MNKLVITCIFLCMVNRAATAQFTVAIPPNAIVVSSTMGSSGVGKIFWICDNDTLTGSGVDMTYFLETGSSFSGSGISKNAYMKTLSSIGGSGIDDSIWHVAGANMMLNPAYDSLCASIVFDYSDAPLPGCPISTGMRDDPGIIKLNVFPNPATDHFFIEPAETGLKIHSVRLTEHGGREVRRILTESQTPIRMDIAGLSPGMYTIQAETSRGSVVHFITKR